jgi:hypothetical protein
MYLYQMSQISNTESERMHQTFPFSKFFVHAFLVLVFPIGALLVDSPPAETAIRLYHHKIQCDHYHLYPTQC